ncbi:TPR-like protein [Coniochaeta ligniaria NRRL 30616]|uniref:TPR-like protein n=1 Tax=Coniochaeta ligniaria NRRL 30616 TaxID=1408157 RepID=A0A1J7J0J6_9PEZI|nr:TPR-like protein [Coniochaeta ligniaria NRRL 30616]
MDMERMRKEASYREVIEAWAAMKLDKNENDKPVRFDNIPFPINPKFTGREDILDTLHKTLDPEFVASSLKSIALVGMGGVGKTQIAIQYAYMYRERYDVILWIAADNAISIGQSSREVAQGLELSGNEDETKDSAAAMRKIKNWLKTTETTCLVIYDNADDLTALRTAWPGTMKGSVLITTQNISVATSKLATQRVQVEPVTDEDGRKMLLKAVELDDDEVTPEHAEHALAISRAFGGLPLALTQIGGFINERSLALEDFLSLYEKQSTKIDARKAPDSDYEYTLSTVWNMSCERLSGSSTYLFNLLTFFEPDSISEDILTQGSRGLDEDFSFLSDEIDFDDAWLPLQRAALIGRSGSSKVLSIHRLVQSAGRKRLNESEYISCFDAVVHMLCWGFPDHSSVDIGHQISAWSRCEKCLPHVNHLVNLVKRQGLKSNDRMKYADLLLRCSWYLYEREMYIIAKGMVEQAISTFEDTTTLEYASAIDLGGLIDLDLTQGAQALEPFKRALEIRKARLGPEDPFIAYSLNNIALAYTEMGELDLAYAAHKEAIGLRLKANSDRIGNSYSNMSSLLLRMGRPDEAEEMLARCPSLKDFTDDTFLSTGNPRFSGDMVLLSRVRLAQGRLADALRLASGALRFRQEKLGNRLKTCDSQYDVASMLIKDGRVAPAMDLLEDIVNISETFEEGEGQRARALYKVSGIYAERGMQPESLAAKEKALELRAKLKPELKDAPFEEAAFAKLCLWMLW